MTTPNLRTLLLLCSLAPVACAGGVDHPDPSPEPGDGLRSSSAPDPAADPTSDAAALAGPTAKTATQTVAVKDWRPWMEAEVQRLREDRPETVDALMTLEARPTRAGLLRLTGPLVRDPEAAPILLHRLLSRGEPAPVRAAIVEALPRTGGDFSAALAELMALETAPEVREVICASLYRAQAPYALDGLALGVADVSPRVRAEALRSLGRRTDAHDLSTTIIEALADPDPVVQLEAARTLGNLRVEAAFVPLQAQLQSSSAPVRLHSLRAMSRIDPEATRALSQLQALRSDPDAKVARLAERLATE